MKRWFLGTILAALVISCYAIAGLGFYQVGLSTGWEAVLFSFFGVTMLGMGCVGGWAIGPRPDEDGDEIASLRTRLEKKEKALEDIERWSHAYPLEVFPEPDFKKVRQLLEAGGITLDAVSASNMRHVVTEVGRMARAALAGEEKP